MLIRKVKFISQNRYYSHLNIGEVYDVFKYIPDERAFWDSIIIILDGEEHKHYLYSSSNKPVFEDVTSEYRDEIIDEILK